jgi:hypothetical protein
MLFRIALILSMADLYVNLQDTADQAGLPQALQYVRNLASAAVRDLLLAHLQEFTLALPVF